MTEKLEQTIKEELSQLTPDAQKAIASLDWLKIAEDIGKQFDLEEEEVEDLQLETLLVLIGAVDLEFFAINIENHVDTTVEKSKNIASEITKKIFKPILEKIPANTKSTRGESAVNLNESPRVSIVQKLDTRFDKLPENIQGVVEKSDYQTILYGIAQAHKLSITQMGTLDAVTTDLMVGTIHPDEFKGALLKSLKLSEEETTSLVNEINEKVFKKIRSQMMDISNPKPKSPETAQPSKGDLETLKSHGIEIVSDKLEIEAPHPILQQKLSVPVQATSIKTDYTMKTKEAPKVTTYKPGEDPYRVVPE